VFCVETCSRGERYERKRILNVQTEKRLLERTPPRGLFSGRGNKKQNRKRSRSSSIQKVCAVNLGTPVWFKQRGKLSQQRGTQL